jgi:hypothetical protein
LKSDEKIYRPGNAVPICVALLISACSSSGDTVPAAQCPEPVQAESEYRIGAGDTLNIVVWRNDELSTTIPVRPDGRISTPLIDDMQASGKTPSQLAADMESVLGEYLRTPDVSVIVTGQGSANQIHRRNHEPAVDLVSIRAETAGHRRCGRRPDRICGRGSIGCRADGRWRADQMPCRNR